MRRGRVVDQQWLRAEISHTNTQMVILRAKDKTLKANRRYFMHTPVFNMTRYFEKFLTFVLSYYFFFFFLWRFKSQIIQKLVEACFETDMQQLEVEMQKKRETSPKKKGNTQQQKNGKKKKKKQQINRIKFKSKDKHSWNFFDF
ncbi:hypothetical protein RFI_12091 [Reticulomyxa filosa]|uniref:Uncharacterized protein n=1 Tax=Reticulomyxa filosa TaxID=46433 RepID=X6NGC9_RETFI|nr:hypothetical protein RFI_12091 [Reticulomyxa filosa]|eukprot:ETO25051.1 hypothetical protein RFI_12091 [Reticulomyxa filosa]